MANALLQQSLSPLLPYLTGDTYEVMVNRPGEVWVDSIHGLHCHKLESLTESHNQTLLQLLASTRFKTMSVKTPILKDAFVCPGTTDRWRVTGVMPPVTQCVAFNFRRLNVKPLSTQTLVDHHYFEKEKLPLEGEATSIGINYKHTDDKSRLTKIVAAIKKKRNLVISGATGSGKSQFLNWCITQIPSDQRIITIEDTQELVINQPNHVNLYYPDDIEQSDCKVTPEVLLKLVLRMKPDRVITGEVTGTELVTMIEKTNTGHPGTMMTIHTNSTAQAKNRMRDILLKVYPNQKAADLDHWISEVVDMIVQVKRQGNYFFIDELWEKEGA